MNPPVLLLDLIDPSKNEWSRMGCAPLSAALENGLFERFDIQPGDRKKFLFHLSVLATLSEKQGSTAMDILLENPYWQYFCGFQHFQTELRSERKAFPRFLSALRKKPLWNPKHLAPLLKLAAIERTRPPANPIPLREWVAPCHQLSMAKELFDPASLEGLRPSAVSTSALLLGILRETIDWSSDWDQIQACFRANAYWQYFCGYEYFSDSLPEGMDEFNRLRPHLRKSEAWKKSPVFKAIKKGFILSRTKDPFLALFIERKLSPHLHARTPMPAQIETIDSTIQGNIPWSLIAAHFKSRHWSTTFIGSDDVLLAQKNLFGPLMRFIPASDRESCERARTRQGDFADVIVEESTESSPGRVILLSEGPANPHGRLEAAIAPVRSLDEFLERKEIQKRYFEALSMIFPLHRFPRSSYEAILAQLREILPHVPGLRERLWDRRSQDAKSFSLRCDVRVFGRGLNPAAFSKFLEDFLGKSADFDLDRSSARDLILQLVERIDSRIAANNTQRRNELYEDLKSAPETQRAVRLILFYGLRGHTATEAFRKAASDGILNFLAQTKDNPSVLFGDCGVLSFENSFWISAVRSALPGLPELLKLYDVFPAKTRSTRRGKTIDQERFRAAEYEAVPIQRGLHSIWRGIPFNDCVGGHPDQLDQLMPERWACSLLEGSITYNIIDDETIDGYCQLIPFEYGGNCYASVDTQWTPFFNQTENGVSLFERCLEKLRPQIPASWKGLVVGGHASGREPYESEILRSLDCYKRGRELGLPNEVHFNDALAARIVAVSEKRGYGAKYRQHYGNRMLTDASILGGPPLVILDLN